MSALEGKVAIVTLTRALAEELGGDEIRVNCVAPGFTISAGVQERPEVVDAPRDVPVSARTLTRDQQPEDVVGAVAFQCGPGPALRWALVGGDAPGALLAAEVELDPATEWLMRCDRGDFDPAVAGRPGSRATIFLEQPVRA